MDTLVGQGIVTKALGHWPEVFGLALQLTGDRHRAEDLCQETYLRLVRVPAPLDAKKPLRPFLFAILRNLVRNESRRRDAAALGGDPGAEASVEPATEASRAEDREMVRRALARLDAHWRAVLYLKDGLGLGYAEIATILDKSPDVVRTTLHRARLRMRDLIKPHWEDNAS